MAFVSGLFILIILCIWLGVSLLAFLISAVCLIVFTVRNKTGNKIGKTPTRVATVVLVLSLVMLLIPTALFGFVVYQNSVPPADYVETDIIIEEDGYQGAQFTADGVLYEAMYLYITDQAKDAKTPIFSYKTAGFLKGSQCGNYYRVENPNGFDLVCNADGLLFAPVEDVEKIKAHYATDSSIWYGYMDEADDGALIELPDAAARTLDAYKQYDMDAISSEQRTLHDVPPGFAVLQASSDGVVVQARHAFTMIDGAVYADTFGYDNEQNIYTGKKLPDEIGAPLIALFDESAR